MNNYNRFFPCVSHIINWWIEMRLCVISGHQVDGACAVKAPGTLEISNTQSYRKSTAYDGTGWILRETVTVYRKSGISPVRQWQLSKKALSGC